MKSGGEVERESAGDMYLGEEGMGGVVARGGWRRRCGEGSGCDGSGASGRWIGRPCAFDRGGRPRKSPLPRRHSYFARSLTNASSARSLFIIIAWCAAADAMERAADKTMHGGRNKGEKENRKAVENEGVIQGCRLAAETAFRYSSSNL